MDLRTRGRRRRCALISALLLVTGAVTGDRAVMAQGLPRPSLSISADSYRAADFDDPPEPELVTNDSRAQTTTFTASAQYPLIFDQGHTLLFIDAAYRQRRFEFKNWPTGFSRDLDRVHEIDLGGTLRTMLGSRWAVIVNGTGQIQSNLAEDSLESEDFKVQGAVVFERPFGPHWSWGFGAAYASTFGRPLPIPLVSFRYDAGGRWHAAGYLPSRAAIHYRLTSHTDLGLRLHAEGGRYHIPQVYPAERDIDDPQLEYMLAKVGPEIKQRLGGWGELSAMVGLSYQMLGIFDGNDELPDSRYDLKPDVFVSCGTNFYF